MTPDYKTRKYQIISYDPHWKDQFETEASVLRSIWGDTAIAIEHIGSTAVPGLAGKPTVDVLVLVDDIASVDQFTKAMDAAGYTSLGEYVTNGARLFVKEKDNSRVVNVHVFQKDHPHVKEMLALRNYLRNHPKIVKQYSELKFDLAKKHPNDYGSYRKYKDAWMEKLQATIRP